MLVYVIALEEELNFELKVSQPEEKSNLETKVEALDKKSIKPLNQKIRIIRNDENITYKFQFGN